MKSKVKFKVKTRQCDCGNRQIFILFEFERASSCMRGPRIEEVLPCRMRSAKVSWKCSHLHDTTWRGVVKSRGFQRGRFSALRRIGMGNSVARAQRNFQHSFTLRSTYVKHSECLFQFDQPIFMGR